MAKEKKKRMTAAQIIARTERFEADRSNWDTLWQDCADFGMPGNNQILRKESPGSTRPDLYDTTAEDSIIQLAAGLYSYMFPIDSKAFVLKVDDPELAENDNVKSWLSRVTDIIHEHLIQSNFRQAFFEFLKSLACFGTGCLYSEKGKTQLLNFINHHMAGIYIAVNSDGVIDTVYRTFEFTARQAVQEFGEKNLGDTINAAYNSTKDKDKPFRFIHAVFPREEISGKSDPLDMNFASIYVSRDEKKIVAKSGYPENPYQVTRFDKDALENYGRSPMMKVLPDVKMINTMQMTRIKGWEKKVDPPIVLPNDGSIWPLATQPGGVLYKTPGVEKPEWFDFKGDLREMEEAIKSVKENIRTGFFLDLFDALINRQNMTATEVMARLEQKLRMLISIIGRIQITLNLLIHRIIGILGRGGALPKQPEELVEQEYRIQYLGRIALALNTLESEGFVKTLEQLKGLGEMERLEWLDNYDLDKLSRGIGGNNGVPADWLKSIDQRDAERAARAEQQRQQAMLDRVPDLAKAVKAGSQKPEEGSPAERVLNEAAA